MGKKRRARLRRIGAAVSALAGPVGLVGSYYLNRSADKLDAAANKEEGIKAGEYAGGIAQQQAELRDLESQFVNLPATLRNQYISNAQSSGTYANTPEWLQGLQSEVQAGARGARTGMGARIAALRRALGMPEFSYSTATEGPDFMNAFNQISNSGIDYNSPQGTMVNGQYQANQGSALPYGVNPQTGLPNLQPYTGMSAPLTNPTNPYAITGGAPVPVGLPLNNSGGVSAPIVNYAPGGSYTYGGTSGSGTSNPAPSTSTSTPSTTVPSNLSQTNPLYNFLTSSAGVAPSTQSTSTVSPSPTSTGTAAEDDGDMSDTISSVKAKRKARYSTR